MPACLRQISLFFQIGLSLVIVVAVAGGFANAGTSTTQPSAVAASPNPADDLFGDTKLVVAEWRRQYPLLPRRPIAQVVHFSEVNGVLEADWPIARSGPVAGRVPLTDLPGDSIVECRWSARLGGMISCTFQYYEMSQTGPVLRHLHVLNSPQRLQVVLDIGTINPVETISTTSLIETLDHTDAEPITLRVQVTRDGQQPVNLALSAVSLTDLEARHPREFEQYLRPMFRQFRQDNMVLSVEEKVAWQVMAGDWHPPADLQSRIAPLIPQLGADQYVDREKAQAALRQIGEPAALYLRFTDRRNWTPEQKARTDKLLAEFFPLSHQQAATLGQDVNFLLDCLGSDDSDLRAATLKHLDHILGRELHFDVDQPAAGRFAAIAELRKQLVPIPATGESTR
jgi:hypothetical protein